MTAVPSRRALQLAFAARRCRCGAPACAVAPGADPVRGVRAASDRNRCLKHLVAWPPPARDAGTMQRLRAP
jgi:hypothetical protein